MGKLNHRYGLTLLEMLIVVGIAGCIVIMLFPAILAVREPSRRATCSNNVKKLGVAVLSYENAHRKLPPSSGVTRNAKGKITAVDGWSWIALILPQLDAGSSEYSNNLWKNLDYEGRPLIEPDKARGTPHADALATSIETLLCPSSGCSPYVDAQTKKEAVTNYKALGASHIESLSIASPHPMKPKFDSNSFPDIRLLPHPDGNIYPGSDVRLQYIYNGTSHTLFVTESVEHRFARWTVGAEATLVGLPPNVEFEEVEPKLRQAYYAPKGYYDAMKNSPKANLTYWTYTTYLDWDYLNKPYDGKDGSEGGDFGPSSNHPGVAIHLYGDGSCKPLKKDVDVNLYMSLIRGRFNFIEHLEELEDKTDISQLD